MAKIQTEYTIRIKDEITDTIKRFTDNQEKILKLTAENSEMLHALLTSQGVFKSSDNQNIKELQN